jgi:hypothetical protein
MASRYKGRKRKVTDEEMYQETLESRGESRIRHFSTPRLNHPTTAQRETMTKHIHVWRDGDRFYKLADHHYGDSRYWWVIAWWNLRPTESHVKIGEGLRIPGPLNLVLGILRERR